jgi:hypothetical protein
MVISSINFGKNREELKSIKLVLRVLKIIRQRKLVLTEFKELCLL